MSNRSVFRKLVNFYMVNCHLIIRNRVKISTLAMVCIILTVNHVAADPVPFRAVYSADFKGLPVGATGIRELRLIAGNRYLFTSSAKSIFASVTEQTTFNWEDQAIPLEYQYIRSGIGRNRDDKLVFDWQSDTVSYNNSAYNIETGTLDKLLYQFQMRADLKQAHSRDASWPTMHYAVADRERVRNYNFTVDGEDIISTPVGDFNTVRVIRIRENQNRKTTLWLVPRYDFLLVRLQQTEDDDDGFELLLQEGVFNGEPLHGL